MPHSLLTRPSVACLIGALTVSGLVLPGRAAERPAEPSAAVLTWGDQGDGTYRNPVLKADYSDPDVIRVGDDFYLVASDFHFMGIQVLHSRDLVNWRIIGQVFNRLPMDPKYEEMRAYGQGTWAPSLRFHAGVFYLYVCTPQDGLFLWHTRDPAGPWSEVVTVKAVNGWEDPCPFWDDDGQAYLVRGQVGAGPIFLHRMSGDGTQLLDDGVEIYRGPVAEGPKMFKRRGWYYISLPEGGVEKGGQTVLRSRTLRGPYERRVVLPEGGPHQGGIVELPNGESWFLGFKSTGYLGRIGHLQPVKWGADDWPVFGDNGRPVASAKKPGVNPGGSIQRAETSDDFAAAGLRPQWQWNHNPVAGAWSLGERPGWLRLRGQPAAEIRLARNTLTQKLWDSAGVAEVKLDVRGLSDGQRAGLAFMSGNSFSWAGVARREGVVRIAWDWGNGPDVTGDTVWLRGVYDGETARLYYSLDGRSYADTGLVSQLRFAQWKGARLALFCYGGGGGAVDFDYFHYRYGATVAELAADQPAVINAELNGVWCEPVAAWDGRAVLLLSGPGAGRDGVGGLTKRLARELAAAGIASLRIDFRGDSGGPRANAGSLLATRIADAEAARAFVLQQPGVNAGKIGMLGWTLGAAAAIEVGGRHPDWFRTMVAWSAPSGDAFASLGQSLAKYPGAFLSVRGSQDIPPAREAEVMKSVPARLAETIVIGGADPLFNGSQPESSHAQRAIDATVDWLERTL